VKNAWTRYQEAKASYFKTKKQASSELFARHSKERAALNKSQRSERSALFAVSWKGRGFELNRHRSVMAAKQQGEKLDLRDRRKEERESMKKRFPRQFPSFKAWLSMDDDQELFMIFRYPGQPLIFGIGEEKPFAGWYKRDIRDYSAVVGGGNGGVKYCRNGCATADFIDYGKTIVFSEKYDEESVTAALQLANQKWGCVVLNGSDEYKQLCVRIAAKHNVKIFNPELKRDYDAARETCYRSGERSNRGWSR
jgi:hypothetical protein